MNIINQTNQPNINYSSVKFGFNIKTHLHITEKALKSIPNISNIDARYVARCSELPDFKRMNLLGWENNAHFYYPNNNNKSYGYNANTKNNALNFFIDELYQIEVSNDKYEKLRHVGCMIHFLQDVQTPVHTESGGLIKKIFDYKKHRDFERGKKFGMTNKLELLEKNFQEIPIQCSSLISLFNNTALDSQKHKVKYSNKNKWLNIQQHCYNRGVAVTKALVNKLIEIYPNLFN